jgi:surface antigen
MKIRWLVAVAALALTGCNTTTGTSGTGSAVGGGILSGSTSPGEPTAIIAALQGGLVRGSAGTGLDDTDRAKALAAEYRALEYAQGGQAVNWSGDSGRSGQVVAAQPYRVGSQDCRQYSHTVNAGGPAKVARGTACRNPDGSWTPLT